MNDNGWERIVSKIGLDVPRIPMLNWKATNALKSQQSRVKKQQQQIQKDQTTKKSGSSKVDYLSPFVDCHGKLRLGGRLSKSSS